MQLLPCSPYSAIRFFFPLNVRFGACGGQEPFGSQSPVSRHPDELFWLADAAVPTQSYRDAPKWLHLSGSERGFCIDVTFVKHVQMKGRLTVSYYYTV